MTFRTKTLIVAVTLVLAMVAGACGVGASFPDSVPAPRLSLPVLPVLDAVPETVEPAVALGSYAPDFTLTDLQGDALSLSDYRGQTVLLNFWASWCAPCREEIPLLQATYDAYHDAGVVVLAVNMGEDESRVKGFAADLNMAFPVFVDESTTVGSLYRVRGAPTTYFIDANGVIRQRYVGALRSNGLVEILSGRSAFPNG